MRYVKTPVIKSTIDLNEALKSFEKVIVAESGTPKEDERDILALVIEDYERKNFLIEAPFEYDNAIYVAKV